MVRATHPHPKKPGSSRSRFALVNWRVRWRLAAVIAVPTLTAAVLGAVTIYGQVNNWQATGRVLHLAQLNADTIKFSQALEDELNVSAAYAATGRSNTALACRSSRRRTPPTAPPTRSSTAPRASPRGPGTSRAPCRTLTRCWRPSTTCRTTARASPARCSPPQRSSGSSARTSSPPRTRSAPPSAPAPTTRPCRATSPRWAPCCGTRTRCRCSGPCCTRRSCLRRGHSARRISPTCSRLPSRQRRTWLTSTPPATRPNSRPTAIRSAAPRWTSRPQTRSWPSRWRPTRQRSR